MKCTPSTNPKKQHLSWKAKKLIPKAAKQNPRLPAEIFCELLMGQIFIMYSQRSKNSTYNGQLKKVIANGSDSDINELNLYGVLPRRESVTDNSITCNPSNRYWKMVIVTILD